MTTIHRSRKTCTRRKERGRRAPMRGTWWKTPWSRSTRAPRARRWRGSNRKSVICLVMWSWNTTSRRSWTPRRRASQISSWFSLAWRTHHLNRNKEIGSSRFRISPRFWVSAKTTRNISNSLPTIRRLAHRRIEQSQIRDSRGYSEFTPSTWVRIITRLARYKSSLIKETG